MKIIYVGPLLEGCTCLQRKCAMEELGHIIKPVNVDPGATRKKAQTIVRRVLRKMLIVCDLAGANDQILKAISESFFDVIWIDKGITIYPDTLKEIKLRSPDTVIAGYTPDDMNNRGNQSRHLLKGLPLYDIYFTTKSYGVADLKNLGCPRVEFIGNAYDSHTHRPIPVSDEIKSALGGAVGFIGQWEKERSESLCFLAESGIDVRIWGYTWERCKRKPKLLRLENKPLWGDNYARAICAFDINLCFLRKANRDLQTTRSIEIPACGGFMLAERTNEHLALFEEGKEAEFFSSNDELLYKVRYYLLHPDKRAKIAAAGRERCIRSGYSNHERLKAAMDEIIKLRGL